MRFPSTSASDRSLRRALRPNRLEKKDARDGHEPEQDLAKNGEGENVCTKDPRFTNVRSIPYSHLQSLSQSHVSADVQCHMPEMACADLKTKMFMFANMTSYHSAETDLQTEEFLRDIPRRWFDD